MLLGEGTAKVIVSLPCSTMTAMWFLLEIGENKKPAYIWSRRSTKTTPKPDDKLKDLVNETMNTFRNGKEIKIKFAICPIEQTTLAKLRNLVIDNYSSVDASLIPDPKSQIALAILSMESSITPPKETEPQWTPDLETLLSIVK